MVEAAGFIPLKFERYNAEQQIEQLEQFAQTMLSRKTVRDFADRPVAAEVIQKAVQVAGTSPSGANQQPWFYVLVTDPEAKRAIRLAAEQEEQENRLKEPKSEQILQSAKADYTGDKSYLETAPALLVLFRVNYGLTAKGEKIKHYYVHESIAISSGFLLTALQHTGLSCAVHAPVKACNTILNRPENESTHLVFAIGHAADATGPDYDDAEQLQRVTDLYERMRKRRVIRHFSDDPVDLSLVNRAIAVAAASAPSGGNLKPWNFAVISDADLKKQLRVAAEHEEKLLYEVRISDEWREALAPLGTGWEKPYLTTVPHLISCFKVQPHEGEQPEVIDGSLFFKDGLRLESAGIAAGILIAALHHAGLFTLTHTPSPMTFLRHLLNRPVYEMPFLLLPIGYPAEGCEVPDITKKPLNEIFSQLG